MTFSQVIDTLRLVFFVTSREKHNCPDCGGKLSGHGKDNRHIKTNTAKKSGIRSVGQSVRDAKELEESTIYRWKKWYQWMKDQLNSNLRAVRQAEEGLFYSLLDNTSSLLERLRQSGGIWLAKAIGITINAGYPAYTQFAYSPLYICDRLDSS